MPETINWPMQSKPRRSRLAVYLFLAVVVLVFVGGRAAVSYWVDLLWFGALGYAQRLLEDLWPRVGNLRAPLRRSPSSSFRRVPRAAPQPCRRPARHTHHLFRRAALRAAPNRSSCTPSLSLPRSRSRSSPVSPWSRSGRRWRFIGTPRTAASVTDPIFGRPLGFYLFTLPAWQLIAGWFLTLAVIICDSGRPLSHRSRRRARCSAGDSRFPLSLPWRGVSIAAGFLLFALAIREYVGRFELLFEQHTIFAGVTYTDAHVTSSACC